MSEFGIKTKIFFNRNSLNDANNYAKRLGISKLLFIADNNILNQDAFRQLRLNYEENGFQISQIKPFDASQEPSYDQLDALTENLRDLDIDAIIGVGGGSVLDIAKGVGVLLKNPGRGIDYKGMDKVKNPGIPVICIPTTAGTGSEVTHTASFIDKQLGVKLGINGRYVAPVFGILLPELTFSCPVKVTIYSGLDAMLHALEAVTAKTATRLTASIGSKAFELLYSNFQKVLSNSNDYDARQEMLLGSYLAGIVMMNAGGGPASGISYPLGVHYNVPHGLAGGIFLPYVIEYNVLNNYAGYVEIYNCLADADLSLNAKEKSLDFAEKMKSLYKNIGVPETVSAYGLNKKDIEILTNFTVEQRKANLELNPIAFGISEVREILSKVI